MGRKGERILVRVRGGYKREERLNYIYEPQNLIGGDK